MKVYITNIVRLVADFFYVMQKRISVIFKSRPSGANVAHNSFGSERAVLFSCNEFDISWVKPTDFGATNFLYDSRADIGPLKGIFLYSGRQKSVLVSYDNAKTWSIYLDLSNILQIDQRVVRLFARSEVFVIQTKEPCETLVFDYKFCLLSKDRLGSYGWHGSQGISESATGVIMFSEYQTGHEDNEGQVCVWRLKPPYDNGWERVLVKRVGRYPNGEVRHFHTCISAPEFQSRWYVSSGDKSDHCKIWLSENDGDNWELLSLSSEEDKCHELGIVDINRLVRFTSATFLGEKLIWATDDSLGIDRSAVVIADIESGVANLEIASLLDVNLARNIIRLPAGFFVICEAKHLPETVFAYLLDDLGKLLGRYEFYNVHGKASPVTNSMGSKAAVDGEFFLPNLGVLTKNKGGLLKVSIKGGL